MKVSDLIRAMTDGRLNLLKTDLDRRVIGDSLERQAELYRWRRCSSEDSVFRRFIVCGWIPHH